MNNNNFNENFEQIYNENILPIMQELEPKRKFLFFKNLLCLISSLVIFVLSLCGCFKTFVTEKSNIFIILLSIICIIYAMFMNKKFKKHIKEMNMEQIVSYIPNLKNVNCYKDKSKALINEYEIEQTQLFSAFTDIKVDDSFYGLYNEISYRMQETILVYDTGKENNGKIFQGIILSLRLSKPIVSTSIVISTINNNNILNRNYILTKDNQLIFIILLLWLLPSLIKDFWLAPLILTPIVCGLSIGLVVNYYFKYKNEKQLDFKNIQLEDVEFSKRFTVLSGDEVEARYLLTPTFMEKLKNLKTVFGAKNIKCSFIDDTITFAIPTNKDLFEIGSLYKPLTDINTMKEFYLQLYAVFDIIDYFKLDEKTGL